MAIIIKPYRIGKSYKRCIFGKYFTCIAYETHQRNRDYLQQYR